MKLKYSLWSIGVTKDLVVIYSLQILEPKVGISKAVQKYVFPHSEREITAVNDNIKTNVGLDCSSS